MSHQAKYYGYTAVFANLNDANDQLDTWNKMDSSINFVILEMALSKDLYSGLYGVDQIFAGKYIVKIKKIKSYL